MWTILTGDDELKALRTEAFWDSSAGVLRVGEEDAHRLADQQAREIALILKNPPLILPTQLIRRRHVNDTVIGELWRPRGATGRGAAGPLLTWLFMWWLAQSKHGGLTASYPADNRALLRPFVQGQPTFSTTWRYPDEIETGESRRPFADTVSPQGERQWVIVELPKVDQARRLNEYVTKLEDRGFLDRSGSDIAFVWPSTSGPQRLALEDTRRYAYVESGRQSNQALRLIARYSTSREWVPRRPDQHAGGPSSYCFEEAPASELSDFEYWPEIKITDYLSETAIPQQGTVYLPAAALLRLTGRGASEILTLLALLTRSDPTTSEVHPPTEDVTEAEFGLSKQFVSRGIEGLVECGLLRINHTKSLGKRVRRIFLSELATLEWPSITDLLLDPAHPAETSR